MRGGLFIPCLGYHAGESSFCKKNVPNEFSLEACTIPPHVGDHLYHSEFSHISISFKGLYWKGSFSKVNFLILNSFRNSYHHAKSEEGIFQGSFSCKIIYFDNENNLLKLLEKFETQCTVWKFGIF